MTYLGYFSEVHFPCGMKPLVSPFGWQRRGMQSPGRDNGFSRALSSDLFPHLSVKPSASAGVTLNSEALQQLLTGCFPIFNNALKHKLLSLIEGNKGRGSL